MGREAVLGVADAPVAVVGVLVVPTPGGAPPEVGQEPGVALVGEVLGHAVPLVAVAVGRPAVGVDHRGHRTVRAGAGRPVEPAGDLPSVEGGVGHRLRGEMRGRGDRRGGRGQHGDRGATRLDGPQLGGPGEGLVGGQDPTVGQPLGLGPGAPLGHDVQAAVTDLDDHQVGHPVAVPDPDHAVAVGVPGQIRPVVATVGELALPGPVRLDQEDLVPPGPFGGEGQAVAVR